MVYEYLNLNGPLVPLVGAFCWSVLIGLSSYFLVFRTKIFDNLLSAPLVPPFLAPPAIVFAFIMGFMASDSWQNSTYARTAMINEASAISRILNIPIYPREFQVKSNAYLQSYLEASLKEEWADSHNEAISLKATGSLDSLELNVWNAERHAHSLNEEADGISSVAVTAFVKAVDDLRIAREERLSLGYLGTRSTKWTLVILLGFIAVLSAVAVHKHNEKTGVIACILSCLTFWIAFSMIALYINPYKWSESVKPVPIRLISETMKGLPK